MRVNEVDKITGTRRESAAELRGLADRLEGQEPDYSALHEAWEVLVELGRPGGEFTRAVYLSSGRC
jgi:hypothetical protein